VIGLVMIASQPLAKDQGFWPWPHISCSFAWCNYFVKIFTCIFVI